eukprot:5171899-Prymnesium_polylepis.2
MVLESNECSGVCVQQNNVAFDGADSHWSLLAWFERLYTPYPCPRDTHLQTQLRASTPAHGHTDRRPCSDAALIVHPPTLFDMHLHPRTLVGVFRE